MFHPKGPSLAELIRQALSSTDRGYDLLAPKFEFTPFRTPAAILEVAARIAAEGGPIRQTLDVACGTGAALRELQPVTSGLSVGVDRSEGMLKQARESAPHQKSAALVRADALALPFASAFDVVTCFGAFGHILEADEPRFVAEVKRVLRPGGRFIFATADAPSSFHPAVWMARGFNLAMRLRNAVLKPEFIMYYLTFLLPRATELLAGEGFRVDVHRQVFPAPYHRLVLVVATSPEVEVKT